MARCACSMGSCCSPSAATSSVSNAVGATPSAFVDTYRQAFGHTPAKPLSQWRRPASPGSPRSRSPLCPGSSTSTPTNGTSASRDLTLPSDRWWFSGSQPATGFGASVEGVAAICGLPSASSSGSPTGAPEKVVRFKRRRQLAIGPLRRNPRLAVELCGRPTSREITRGHIDDPIRHHVRASIWRCQPERPLMFALLPRRPVCGRRSHDLSELVHPVVSNPASSETRRPARIPQAGSESRG